jgi:hypothetical protein
MTWPALATMPLSSSGTCWSSTEVSESEIEVATGSASWVHTGRVRRAQSARVMSVGSDVSCVMEVASSSQSAATFSAWRSCSRSAELDRIEPCAAIRPDSSLASCQSTPSPLAFMAFCNWLMRRATMRGSVGSPAAPASFEGSSSPSPAKKRRNISRNSSSAPPRGSSAMAPTLVRWPRSPMGFRLG